MRGWGRRNLFLRWRDGRLICTCRLVFKIRHGMLANIGGWVGMCAFAVQTPQKAVNVGDIINVLTWPIARTREYM